VKRAARVLGAFAAIALALTSACGGGARDTRAVLPNPTTPRWEDAFDRIPPLLAVVHPQALKRDAIYGPLFARLSMLAATRNPAVAATRSLEAFESCDEIIVAMDDDGGSVVLRGVRADFDPAKIVDGAGALVWRAQATPGARVPEYTHEERGTTASLFVLPERTWFIAVGDGRATAREAFAHPSGRPALTYDRDALVAVRVRGPALLAHMKPLRAHGALEAVGAHLEWLTLALAPGKDEPLRVSLVYADEDSAARAEITARHAIDVLRDRQVTRFQWLFDAKIARNDPKVVVMRAPLPPPLVAALTHANDPRDLDDPEVPE
jgi:hypothetical protein